MKFALIKDGIVKNIIVAEQDFLPHIQDQYDYIIDVSEMAHYPGPGWSYDGQTFSTPILEEQPE